MSESKGKFQGLRELLGLAATAAVPRATRRRGRKREMEGREAVRWASRFARRVRAAMGRQARGLLIPKPNLDAIAKRDAHFFDETHYCRRCDVSARRAYAGGISCRMQRVRLGNRARKTRRGYR